jgi:hypothetical protein
MLILRASRVCSGTHVTSVACCVEEEMKWDVVGAGVGYLECCVIIIKLSVLCPLVA